MALEELSLVSESLSNKMAEVYKRFTTPVLGASLALLAACGVTSNDESRVGVASALLIEGEGACRSAILTYPGTNAVADFTAPGGLNAAQQAYLPERMEVLSAPPLLLGQCGATLKFAAGPQSTIFTCFYSGDPDGLDFQSCQQTSATPSDLIAIKGVQIASAYCLHGIQQVGISVQASVGSVRNASCDLCNPSTGPSNAPIGTACSDGNPCTVNDVCGSGGSCGGSNAPADTLCSDGNVCNGLEKCNGTGTCMAGTDAPPEGASCSDGNLCNGSETCQAGTCTSGSPLSCTGAAGDPCDDNNACTVDSCDPNRGIVNELISGCGAPPSPSQPPTTTAWPFEDSIAFLYSGSNPIQHPNPGEVLGLDSKRIGVLRGLVLDSNGTPRAGARITVVGHPEFGYTDTRSDGYYDLAVNTGSTLTVSVRTNDRLEVQRPVRTTINEISVVETVVLTAEDPATPFIYDSSSWQLIVGTKTNVGEDADNARIARIYVPEHTTINGFSGTAGQSIPVNVTEYTRADGQRRMPGALPPSSGYTYAVGVTFPTVQAAGLSDVRFNHPVVLYVTNFTGYEVGAPVPMGYYDKQKGAWFGDPSGRIIKLTGKDANGLATYQETLTPGAPLPPGESPLNLPTSELTALAQIYDAIVADTDPQKTFSLWRAEVEHFTDWDANWGFGLPDDAIEPAEMNPSTFKAPCPTEISGSIIGCETQVLGEQLPIVGTPFSLVYKSGRVEGYSPQVSIRMSDGRDLPPSLITLLLEVRIAGRLYHYEFQPRKNFSWVFTWDGFDAYKRRLYDPTTAAIRVGYEYAGTKNYRTPTFGGSGGDTMVTGDRAARRFIVWRDTYTKLHVENQKRFGLGGWSIDAHHTLSPDGTLAFGDGSERVGLPTDMRIDTIAGGAVSGSNAEGIPATQADLHDAGDLAVGPDGTVYIAFGGWLNSQWTGAIREIRTDGTIWTIAGSPGQPHMLPFPESDGDAAVGKQIHPISVAVDAKGAVYFADRVLREIWRVDRHDGSSTLTRVAGSRLRACEPGADCGNHVDAKTAAAFRDPGHLQIAADGSIFLLDTYADYFSDTHGYANPVRRIGTEGIISNFYIAPRASGSPYSDLNSLFINDADELFAYRHNGNGGELFKIEPSGGIGRNIAVSIYSGANSWCRQAGGQTPPWSPKVAVVEGNRAFVPCYSRIVVKDDAVGPQPSVDRAGVYDLAGTLTFNANTPSKDGRALEVPLTNIQALTPGKRQDFYFIEDWKGTRVRHMRRPSTFLPGPSSTMRVPSVDGSLVYEFDASWRHSRTLSGLTGIPIHTFEYGSDGLLATIKDTYDQATTISRSGQTITIASPYGPNPATTTLTLDATTGYLASVSTPNGETTLLSHRADGLLEELEDPRGLTHRFTYNALGRLVKDVNALPGSIGTRLTFEAWEGNWAVETLSPENRDLFTLSLNGRNFSTNILERRRVVTPDGMMTQTDRFPDGTSRVSRPNGLVVATSGMSSDPRLGELTSFARTTTTWNYTAPQYFTTDPPAPAQSFTVTQDRSGTPGTNGDPFSASTVTWTTTVAAQDVPTSSWLTTYQQGTPATLTRRSAVQTRSVVNELDSFGRVQKTIFGTIGGTALEPIEYQYDDPGTGLLLHVKQGTRILSYDYDGSFVKKLTAPDGKVTEVHSHDLNGRPLEVYLPGVSATSGSAPVLSSSYDPNGNVTSLTPPGKTVHTFGWDNADNLASYQPPVGTATTYAYDNDSLLRAANHPGGAVTVAYDSAGRTSGIWGPDQRRLSYDGMGRLETLSVTGGIAWTYAYQGALLQDETMTGLPLTPSPSISIHREFDNLLRSRARRINTGGVAGPELTVEFDLDGLVTSAGFGSTNRMTVTRGPNVPLLTDTQLGAVSAHFDYNAFGEVSQHKTTWGSTTFTIDYLDRDAAGRILSKRETLSGSPSRLYEYEYDSFGRLANEKINGNVAETYAYDDNGNRPFNHDGFLIVNNADQLLNDENGTTFGYTPNGELASKTAGGQTKSFTYDSRGNLRLVSGLAAGNIEYVIDGANRRVGKKRAGTFVQGFVYDGDRVVAELDAMGAVKSTFVYATGSHSPDFIRGSDGTIYDIVKDHLGSPRFVVQATGGGSGTIVQQIEYDPWGNASATGPAPEFQPFGFAGGLWDRDTGLVRFGARDYDPTTGRWTSKDASRFGGGLNFYAYAKNDPVNYIDTNGHYAFPVVVGLVLVLGALLSTDQPHAINAGEAATATMGAGLMLGMPAAGAGGAILGGAVLGTGELYSTPADMAAATGLPGAADGPQDAYRHCLASCIAAKNYGEGFASFAGNFYESINPDPSASQCSMDNANNASGRGLANSSVGSSPQAACSSACLGALGSGGLQTAP